MCFQLDFHQRQHEISFSKHFLYQNLSKGRQDYKHFKAILIPLRAIILLLPIKKFTSEPEIKEPSDILKLASLYL